MKTATIEQKIMAATPKPTPNAAFTNRVMRHIKEQPDTPKRPLFGFLQHIPKVALALVIVAIVLALSGTAYAVYTALWQKPAVHSQGATQNQFGRTEVIVDLQECAKQDGEVHYEIKKGATITPDDVPKIIQAKCEKDIINTTLVGDPGRGHRASETTDGEVVPQTHLTSAVVITSIDEQHINFGHELNINDGPYPLSPDTKYIADGVTATRANFKPGDTVMFVTTIQVKYTVTKKDGGVSAWGEQVGGPQVNTVIKLDLPAAYYNAEMLNQIVERKACLGNPDDTCIEGARIELYEGVNPYAGNPPLLGPESPGEIRQLQGVIQRYSAHLIVIKTSSGKVIELSLPRNIIAEFNSGRSANYDGTQVKEGDTLTIDYFTDDKTKPTTDIAAHRIMNVQLQLDLVYKSDPLTKY